MAWTVASDRFEQPRDVGAAFATGSYDFAAPSGAPRQHAEDAPDARHQKAPGATLRTTKRNDSSAFDQLMCEGRLQLVVVWPKIAANRLSCSSSRGPSAAARRRASRARAASRPMTSASRIPMRELRTECPALALGQVERVGQSGEDFAEPQHPGNDWVVDSHFSHPRTSVDRSGDIFMDGSSRPDMWTPSAG